MRKIVNGVAQGYREFLVPLCPLPGILMFLKMRSNPSSVDFLNKQCNHGGTENTEEFWEH
jgi:hypothetical protein